MPAGLEALAATPATEHESDHSHPDQKRNTAATLVEGGLSVEDEVLAPDDIWEDQVAELQRRRQGVPPAEFQRWVIQQSAAMITDRIAESLLYQKANSKLGDNAGPAVQAYVDGEIRKIVTEEFDGVQRKYEKSLEAQGKTLADVREQLRRQAIIGAYIDSDVREKIPEPTRAELYEAFESIRESMRRPGRRSMSLIDIRTSRFLPEGVASPTREQSDEARTKALAEATVALDEVRSGTPFADVAKRRSHGLHAIDGGKWGWITADAVRERFLPAVSTMEKLSEGEVSDIVAVPDGFFIVCCDEVQVAFEPDFVTAQPLIHRRIASQRHNRAIGQEVSRLRVEANIKEESLRAFHKRVVEAALASGAISVPES
jgi:parvulin-like peptidyl-prolyl isomerase